MGPKKGTKMSLTDFIETSDFASSWADDMEDLPPPPVSSDRSSFAGSSFDRSDRGGDRYGDRSGDRYGDRERAPAPERPERVFDSSTRGSLFKEPQEPPSRRYDPQRSHSRDEPRAERGDDYRSGEYRSSEYREREYREPLPIPDAPPYTAHLGNLATEITEGDIEDLFSGIDIESIRLIKERGGFEQARPFAYVEFKEREGLERALDKSQTEVRGRPVRVSVASARAEPKEDRTQGEWRAGKPLPVLERRTVSDGKVRDFDSWERRGPLPPVHNEERRQQRSSTFSSWKEGGDREGREDATENTRSFDNWRSGSSFDTIRRDGPSRSREGSSTPEPPRPMERRRLNLQKRTQPVEGAAPAAPAAAPASTKASPFGGAAPVDTAKKLLELEQKRVLRETTRRHEREGERTRIAERPVPVRGALRGTRMPEARQPRERLARPAGANGKAEEEKKEEAAAPLAKQFSLLRTTEAGDDFIPDIDDDEPGTVVDSGVVVAPAAMEAEIGEKATSAEEAIQEIVNVGEEEWSVVPKTKRTTNGK
ncbi:uncharacterized protein V1518DRAFT_411184 [Limtongia smithiae]|uniref:uncharacterized protein n=1 Tax=Limtongia smithiae TaxID=1125753 RepID=UPI0034CF0038